MSARRTRQPGDHPGRYCASCARLLVEQRPVFLVGDTDGRILGPYHASCAERLVIGRKFKDKSMVIQGELFGSMRPTDRRES